jgi:hypothetical protein
MAPEIGDLNNFLALQFERSLKCHYDTQIEVVFRQFYMMLREVYYSYRDFKVLIDITRSCESLMSGINYDNSPVTFDLRQKSFNT